MPPLPNMGSRGYVQIGFQRLLSDALGRRTPVSRNLATARTLNEPCGTVQLLMYFMGVSGDSIYRVTAIPRTILYTR
jgi:hypothetical protein